MLDLQTTLIVALTSLALVGMTGALFAWCFRGWLDVKRLELSGAAPAPREKGDGSAMSRIEVADLKERVRRLEAIAAGVDL